jgi:hypothetical protein
VIVKAGFTAWLWPASCIGLAVLGVFLGADRPSGRVDFLAQAFLIVGVALAWAAYISRTIVTEQTVERRDLFGTRRLERSEIRGYRRQAASRYSSANFLLFAGEAVRPLRIADTTAVDGTWVGGLPDLVAREREVAEQALEANPRLGPSVRQRRMSIRAIRVASVFLMVLGGGLSFASIFWLSEPHALLLAAAAAPLLAVALALGLRRLGAQTLDGREIPLDTRWLIQPSAVLLFTSLGFGARAFTQLPLIDSWSLLPAAVLIAAPILALVGWLDRGIVFDRNLFLPVVFLAAGIAYAAGALAEIDIAFDRSPGQGFVTEVTETYVSHHRSSTSYHLVLAPWNGLHRPVKTEITNELYDQLRQGERICVTQHPGALGFAWFTERPC